ncbi:Cytochrome P450 1A1 [Halotydeus destructor]|nr:Cytochrome P450 1A1 [Halotydeus destructor]
MKKIFFDTRSSPFPLTSYLIHFLKLFEWTNEKNLPLPNSLATIMANVDNLRRYILQEVKVHHEHFKPTDEKDYLDMYIGACKTRKARNLMVLKTRHSYGLIQQLLDASSSTMKDCLEWTFVYLAKYDVHQNDLVQEVSNVIGFDRKPAFADREKLVYLEAFLNEVLRKSSVLPLNLQHCASKETKLGSYTIPEGFQLIVNLWALHHDPTVWKEPETFDPKRFWQSEEGETIVNQSFLPFSYGSRSCPGEQLARTVMVTLIASVIQKFRVVEAPEIELKEEGRICGFSHVPSDSRVIFEPRGH